MVDKEGNDFKNSGPVEVVKRRRLNSQGAFCSTQSEEARTAKVLGSKSSGA